MILSTADDNSHPHNNDDMRPAIIGNDQNIKTLHDKIDIVSKRNCTVLICGESGTGKELVARNIHAAGPRACEPFITADCTTLRDTLFESQLFGHCKGAFTGAVHSTIGLFRAADSGTLFLDEIGELEPNIQSKLLRCIQENAVIPLGAVEPIPVDVRIIAATNRNLKDMVDKGKFREDLYYRLNVVSLKTPPLRALKDDIVPIAEHLLAQQADIYGEKTKVLTDDAKNALENYSWPGNVRELRNVMERAFVFTENGHITVAHFPKVVSQGLNSHNSNGRRNLNGCRKVVTLEKAERCLIKRALRATNGNQSSAARLLGVERHRLLRMIHRHNIYSFAKSARA